jgi:hypothetical protein
MERESGLKKKMTMKEAVDFAARLGTSGDPKKQGFLQGALISTLKRAGGMVRRGSER